MIQKNSPVNATEDKSVFVGIILEASRNPMDPSQNKIQFRQFGDKMFYRTKAFSKPWDTKKARPCGTVAGFSAKLKEAVADMRSKGLAVPAISCKMYK